MLEGGYVRLYRSLLNWEWYDDQNTKILFLHLLLTVNYEPKVWHGITIDRGQRISSYAVLAEELNMSVKSVRTAVNHLKQTGEVAHQTTPQYGLFTVINYDKFQPRADDPADEGQTEGSQRAVKGQQRNKANKANKAKEDNIYLEIVTFLNEKADTKYRPTSAKTRSLIDARLNEKFTLDDFKAVIAKKCAEWNHEPKDDQKDMRPYLRPETLFGPKFEGYLNQASKEKQYKPMGDDFTW